MFEFSISYKWLYEVEKDVRYTNKGLIDMILEIVVNRKCDFFEHFWHCAEGDSHWVGKVYEQAHQVVKIGEQWNLSRSKT